MFGLNIKVKESYDSRTDTLTITMPWKLGAITQKRLLFSSKKKGEAMKIIGKFDDNNHLAEIVIIGFKKNADEEALERLGLK